MGDGQNTAVRSPLDGYLRASGVSLSLLARVSGINPASLVKYRRGERVPGLVAAYALERATKGVISMESWLGLPAARAELSRMQNLPAVSSDR